MQKKTSKAIQDKIHEGQEVTSKALTPFTRELKNRIDQMETLQSLPHYLPEIEMMAQSTPKKNYYH